MARALRAIYIGGTMTITVEIEKHPLPDFHPSKWCEWCVTIKNDDPGGFPRGTVNSKAEGASMRSALDDFARE
jgi:hypothetical protein